MAARKQPKSASFYKAILNVRVVNEKVLWKTTNEARTDRPRLASFMQRADRAASRYDDNCPRIDTVAPAIRQYAESFVSIEMASLAKRAAIRIDAAAIVAIPRSTTSIPVVRECKT